LSKASPLGGDDLSKDEIEHIALLIDQKHGPALPGYLPPEAVTYLMKLVISRWAKICLDFFESAKHDAEELVSTLCKQHFATVQKTGLSPAVRFISFISAVNIVARSLAANWRDWLRNRAN